MKTKNRLLASVLCLLMVVFCVVGLTACGGDDKCSHQWGEWTVATNATCTEAGIQERKCSECGETETSAINALGHDWNEATCSTPKTCKTCSTTDGTANAHAYTVETVKDEALKSAANCTSAAVYYKSCSCGAISTNDADTFTSGASLEHKDDNTDHLCDYNCGKNDMGTHADENKDHTCDYGCAKTFGEHTDGDDNNHLCDYGCGQIADAGCYDTVVDGKCDECGVDINHTCVDAGKDHACDICSTPMGEHSDGNKDHNCDYGCADKIGTCADGDKDHDCDYGCDKTFGEHADGDDNNHLCDYGCGLIADDGCYDTVVDDKCDECGATTGSTLEHTDADFDHICDNNCGKNDMGTHADSNTDNDHVCDYGCGAVLENCSDVETDNDHNCDVCDKANVTSHAHVENTALATEATCDAAATKTYECNCGHTYEETYGDALGHSITGVTPIERPVEGCDCEYVLVYICQNDNCDNENKEVIGETVYYHNYIASISRDATCETPGEKTFECSACGDTSKTPEEIPANATGHKWVEGTVTDGARTDRCSICETQKMVMVSDSNSASSNASDLANTDVQLKVDDNTNANIQLGQGVADAIGDKDITISAGVVDKNTLESMGVSKDQLDQIGANTVYDFNIKDGNGTSISDFGENNFVTITLPYTLSDGEDIDSIAVWFISDTCQVEDCDKGESCVDAHKLVSIEATYNNGFVTFQTNHFSIYTVTRLTPADRCALYGHGYVCQHVEGSCTKDAYDLYVCVRCHYKYIDEDTLVVADGHDYTSDTHAATCTENGYILYSCNDCGHSYRTKLNATGHAWSVEDSDEASCVADGYTKYSCANNNCDEEYTVTYAKLAHVYTNTVVPATCTADGYTIHDCDNCECSYTDAYVDALGHAYESTTWAWAADYSSATLTFVCENDDEHVMVLNATIATSIVNGTCSNFVKTTYTATLSYDGTDYADEKVVELGTPDHNFSTDWSKDEDEHWHECVCGEKTDVSEHTFENATVTKNPTCAEAGESTTYCVCGETKVTTVPATGEHDYNEEGVCGTCGKEEVACDHTDLHKESIDLGELGACDWVLYYFTCECGEVKIIDLENSRIPCNLEESYEEDEYVDENGNTVMSMKYVCVYCGMEVSATAICTEDGCTESSILDYTFKVNGVVVIDNIGYEQTNTWHSNIVRATIDLSEYGACGGSLIVYKCTDCGEITEIYDFDIDCNVDLENEPEAEQVTDENGVVHYIQKVECPDCDLALVVDTWVDELSACETITYMTITVRYGETNIVEFKDAEYDDGHEYEYDYVLNGDSCEDGVKINAHCSICGDTYSYNTAWHVDVEYNVEIDLAEHSTCGGTIIVNRCKICGYVTNMRDADINCDMSDKVEEEILDENGEVIGYKYTCTCPDCGLVFIEQEWIEYHSACEYTEYEGAYIYKGEECIFAYEKSWSSSNHEYEYTYETESNDCNDRYKVIEHCTVCGETDEWYTSGHRPEEFEMNLTDHNGCEGTISGIRCAICGEITSLYGMNVGCDINDEATPDEFVDENGITHYITTMTCPDCGLKFVADTWTVQESACVTHQYQVMYIYVGEECIFEYTYSYTNSNHQYEYRYELQGETCEDGWSRYSHCTVCGYTPDSWTESYGHVGHYFELDMSEYGCEGIICGERCEICGEISYMDNMDIGCNIGEQPEPEEIIDANGITHYVMTVVCPDCGLKFVADMWTVEESVCVTVQYQSMQIYKDDTLIFEYVQKSRDESHNYKHEFIMNGTSCTDGYTIITTCEDCDAHYEETSSYHNTYTIIALDDGHKCCDEHCFEVRSCPCGYNIHIILDEYTFTYDEEQQMYVCENCDLTIAYNVKNVEEGCALVEMTTVVVKIADEQVYNYEKENSYANHNFADVEVSVVDGVTYITTSCDKCDTVNSTEMLSVEMEQHGGEYYYDYTFTPGETAKYTIIGLSDRDTYVTLYKMVAGQMIEISYNDDGGSDSQFYLTANLTEGTTYIYRISFYGQDEEGTISFALTKGVASETECQHNFTTDFSVLLDSSETCEDGVLYGKIYTTCGCIRYIRVEYQHTTVLKDRVDFSEHGACYGEFVYYSCACSQGHDMYLSNACYDTWTDNEYYDKDGRLIHVDVRTCSECGLRYTRSWYTVKDRATCTLTYYYTVVINVGANLIVEMDYTVVEVNHDYEVIGTLMNGAGSSCEDGVVITYKCKDCEHEESYETYEHETYEKEHIDLSEHGSVCGGYATVYGCACGERGSLSIDHSLCEWGGEWCEPWIENAITDGQYQINGWNGFGYDSYLYICAVTDPEDAACAYKIRYARYWLKDENSCMAYCYETWQFGYNEETGTYEYAVTFKTGSSRAYHNYVDNSTDNHRKYDCSDCESYYYENWYYDDNNNCTKYEKLVSNTLDNGYDKYYECVKEYATDADGIWYTSREYRKSIYSDGTEYWSEELRTEQAYTGPFSDNGRKVSYSYTNSNGESYSEEYAYDWYNGYKLDIYTHRIEGDCWYRYDYTYTFDNGCVRKEVYTNSEGAREENTYDICRFWNGVTIKNPTCTQDGEQCNECVVCGKHTESYTVSPQDHNWVRVTDNWYFCFTCGLENANGVSGDIIMEDLTETYGNGEYYVVGYYARNNVEFSKYVSLLLADGTTIDVLTGIEFTTIDGIRAYAFSKAAVEAWATENGYTDYDVRFSFVPVGSDGSFDYGVTFTEPTVVTDTISGNISFTDYIGAGETKSYTITPTEDGVWTFTSFSDDDTYATLCDANGNTLDSDDDDGQGLNFKIIYELKAGETYTINVRWLGDTDAGTMALLFDTAPVVVE